MTLLKGLVLLSSISFLFFGISCLFAPYMRKEFYRYELIQWKKTVGILQILGALGLIFGHLGFPIFTVIASGGLSLLMLLGFGVRLKIKDSIVQSTPAIFYAVINGYICILSLREIGYI